MTRRHPAGASLLAASLVAIAVVLWAVSSSSGVGDSRASGDRGPEGSAALAGVLGRLGYQVEPLRLGLHVLSRRAPGLLFVISPPGLLAWPALTDADGTRVLAWVRGGGTAVLVQDRPGPLLDALDVVVDPVALPRQSDAAGGRAALPVRPSVWTAGGPLVLRGRGLPAFDDSFSPLFSVRGAAVVAVQARGAGQIVVVSDPYTISNSGLGRGGNLSFYVAIARSVLDDGGTVYFDDLHAGGGDDHGVVAYVRRAGGGPALLVVGLLILLLIWRIGAREATPSAAPPPPQILGGAEHIRALAGLYERADLAQHALDVTSRQFRRAVEERAGVPWELDLLDRWLRTELGEGAALDFIRVRNGFGRLFGAAAPDTGAVLAVARLAARFEERWLGERRTRGAPTSRVEVL